MPKPRQTHRNKGLPALELAIMRAGSVTKLAAANKVRSQAIAYWKKKGIPIGRVPKVSDMTGIPRHELRPDRPDLFPPLPRSA